MDRSPGALVVLRSGDVVERFERSSSANSRPNHRRSRTLVEAAMSEVVGAEEKSKDGVEGAPKEGAAEGVT